MQNIELNPIQRLSRDLKSAAVTLSRAECRFLVDAYYQIQEYRKAAFNQERSLETSGEPHAVITWYAEQSESIENQIKRALDSYSGADPVGQWARSIVGIGPVIAAGLLCHIDIEKAPTVGHIWSFAGLDPTKEWGKGEKRPWNAALKTLCWKIGESFVKVSGHKDDIYGKIYLERKALEQARNERGEFADQARAAMEKKKFGKTTDAYGHYSAGRLSPAHIHARAKRYAVKLFLSHLHEVWYTHHFKKAPPLPYPIAFMGHAHKIEAKSIE